MAAVQEVPAAVRRPRRRPNQASYSLRRLNRDPLSVLRELQQNQGDVAKARVGGATLFLLSHPDQIGHVLIDRAHHYVRALTVCDRRAEPVPAPGQTMDTELDLESRRLVQPAFSRARVSRLWPEMAALADERAAAWPLGERIDLLEQVRALVVELAIQTVFERDLDLPAAEIAEHARRCMEALLPATSRLQQLAELRHIGWLRATGTAHEALAGTLARGLDERRGEEASASDALSLLLLAADRGGWTDENLITRAAALTLTFSDSTAPATAWALYELANHPEACARIAAEADAATGLDEAPYLRAVIHETLRLYPPSWRFVRRACGDDVIAGRAVKPGDYVWICPYLVHRDPRFWDEPERFAPERWLSQQPGDRPRLAYIPFGAGARKCLGDLVGWQAMAATILAVTRRFEPRLAEPVRHDPSRPVRRPRGGIQVFLESRTAAEREERRGSRCASSAGSRA